MRNFVIILFFFFFSMNTSMAYEFKIHGHITDIQNNMPIAKQYVNIHDQIGLFHEKTIYTDNNGYYSTIYEIENTHPFIFIIKTYGFCENFWVPYIQEVECFEGEIVIDFQICHNPLGLEQIFIIEGFVKNENTNEAYANHEILITENYINYQTDTISTNQNGYFSQKYILPPLYEVDFVTQTKGNCNLEWINYSDTAENFNGNHIVNFQICHDPEWFIIDFIVTGNIIDNIDFLPIINHLIYVENKNNNQIYSTKTNNEGIYNINFPINLLEETEIHIFTYSICNSNWTKYEDSYIVDNNTYNKDFTICKYLPEDIECKANFDYYVNNSSKEVTFFDISLDNINDRYWTLGDGYFSSNQTFTHIYSYSGVYNVCLNITTENNCLNTYCNDITVGNQFNISGKIYAGNNLLPKGKTLLFNKIENQYKYCEFSDIDNGNYYFDSIFDGSYAVCAVPEFDTSFLFFPKYLPTYNSSEINWLNVTPLNLNNDINDCNIHLIKYDEIFYGNNQISGKIFIDESSDLQINNYEINVIIYDEYDNAINFSSLDTNFCYSFKNLPAGKYKIYPENAERYTNPKYINFVNSNSILQNINFIATDNYIDFFVNISENLEASDLIKIYPNPFSDYININIEKTKEIDIFLYDITGKIVYQKKNLSNHNFITTPFLKKGIYLIQICEKGNIILTSKIIKN